MLCNLLYELGALFNGKGVDAGYCFVQTFIETNAKSFEADHLDIMVKKQLDVRTRFELKTSLQRKM